MLLGWPCWQRCSAAVLWAGVPGAKRPFTGTSTPARVTLSSSLRTSHALSKRTHARRSTICACTSCSVHRRLLVHVQREHASTSLRSWVISRVWMVCQGLPLCTIGRDWSGSVRDTEKASCLTIHSLSQPALLIWFQSSASWQVYGRRTPFLCLLCSFRTLLPCTKARAPSLARWHAGTHGARSVDLVERMWSPRQEPRGCQTVQHGAIGSSCSATGTETLAHNSAAHHPRIFRMPSLTPLVLRLLASLPSPSPAPAQTKPRHMSHPPWHGRHSTPKDHISTLAAAQ